METCSFSFIFFLDPVRTPPSPPEARFGSSFEEELDLKFFVVVCTVYRRDSCDLFHSKDDVYQWATKRDACIGIVTNCLFYVFDR